MKRLIQFTSNSSAPTKLTFIRIIMNHEHIFLNHVRIIVIIKTRVRKSIDTDVRGCEPGMYLIMVSELPNERYYPSHLSDGGSQGESRWLGVTSQTFLLSHCRHSC